VGFLEGWGQNGAEPRPRFDIVTGVSTGSMIAPVIFLNDRERLAKLRGLYANLRNEDVFTPRSTLSLLSATSLYDNAPLRRTVTAMLDDDKINAIAAENGPRTLAVLATNLDSGVPDVFDLTDIATDQLLRTSVESLLPVGRQRGNVARSIDAAPLIDYGASVPQPGMPEPGPCKLSTNSADIFDPVFQACLAEQGALTGRSNPIPWRLTVAGTRITRNAGRSLDR